jgi:hemerythrin
LEENKMVWTQNLSVGVEEIDCQHKELIKRVNDFYAAMKTIEKKDEILKMLRFLEDYVVIHFSDEQVLQVKYKYPLYPEHVKLHKAFIEDIKKIRKDVEDNGITVATGLIIGSTLSNWLINHISVKDKALGVYIQEQMEE